MWKKNRGIALVLCAAVILAMAGCGNGAKGENLTIGGKVSDGGGANSGQQGDSGENAEKSRQEPDYASIKLSYEAGDTEAKEKKESAVGAGENSSSEVKLHEDARPITEFGVTLFQNTVKQANQEENVLVSPLSIFMALSMTANGAAGETKTQMEAVLGENRNAYLRDYRLELPEDENCKLNLANAIWFKEDEKLEVKEAFLQTNAEYYDAAVYKAPFDETTLKDINQWVEYNTDGMIKNMLDRITSEAALYLVNALSFDAEWDTIYTEDEIRPGEFTKEDGTVQQTEMMYSTENRYLEDELATGFVKYYHNEDYAFVALLPKEGVSMADYVESLTGEHLAKLLANPSREEVKTKLPKFETEYSVTLNEILIQMGMVDAFDLDFADFSAMATVPPKWNLSISKVLHKTFISVDERGTKAGAATVVQMDCTTSSIDMQQPKMVYLDRPFVYLIVDCSKEEPIFIGTMMDVEK